MNIYEQLNKINDAESLSEKYNVKNAKELKKIQESSTAEPRPDLNTVTKTLFDTFPVLQDALRHEVYSIQVKRISETIYTILLHEYLFGSWEEDERHEQEEKAKRHSEPASNPKSLDAAKKFKAKYPDVDWKFKE